MFLDKRIAERKLSKQELLDLASAYKVGELTDAKKALTDMLTPLKKMLSVYELVENLDGAIAAFQEVNKVVSEQKAEVDTVKKAATQHTKTLQNTLNKIKAAQSKLDELDKAKAGVEGEIVDAKSRLAQTLVNVNKEIEAAVKQKEALLRSVKSEVEAAKQTAMSRVQEELDRMKLAADNELAGINAAVDEAKGRMDRIKQALNVA